MYVAIAALNNYRLKPYNSKLTFFIKICSYVAIGKFKLLVASILQLFVKVAMCVCMHACMYVAMYVYVCVCVYICMYVTLSHLNQMLKLRYITDVPQLAVLHK